MEPPPLSASTPGAISPGGTSAAAAPLPPEAAPASAAVLPAAAQPLGPWVPPPPVPLSPAERRRRRVRRTVVLLVLAVLLGLDLSRPPSRQVSAFLLLGSIHLYQATLSPRMPALGVQCRFTPTCSHYAVGAIERYGALGGSLRAAWRILRCGPWTPLGTYDPP